MVAMGTFHDKRYTAFFSIFLQLPSTNPLQNSKKKRSSHLYSTWTWLSS